MGEKTACRYLKKCGYSIVDKNHTTRFGEIDIIAIYGEFIVFVEVKTRSLNPISSALSSVDTYKQNRIRKTAMSYLKIKESDRQPRFDVIEVLYDSGKFRVKEHIIDAF
ncbi:MAG: YraN family protein [Ruminococcaceae bacterium]|nr:YraN family protein [Oscillospiraceae bacterium]